jgi:uncharacterized membrane protein (DUF4010 family)
MVAAEWLSRFYGQGGLLGLAAVSGLADVDPITMSTAESVNTKLTEIYASEIILVAAGANLIAKCTLAAFFGGLRFAAPLTGTALAAAAVSAALFVLYPTMG